VDKGCIHFVLFVALLIVAAIIGVVGIYYQSRARPYFRPPSLMARLSPVARFRLRNFAPEAAYLVARGRIAAFAFLCIVVGALALGQVGLAVGATACPNPAFNRTVDRRASPPTGSAGFLRLVRRQIDAQREACRRPKYIARESSKYG
jgi:hypothetical protein